jgi:hypothetical protein
MLISHPSGMKVWSWRQSVIEAAQLSATTRHVLLTLSVYMNDVGDGCFPTIDTLSANTGLTCRSVITALNMAEIAGFIEKTQHGFAGSQWRRNEYRARLPDHSELHYGIIPPTKIASDRMKNIATKRVANALVSGSLAREACCVCTSAPAEAHHADYSKPLEVFWLCRDHHRRLHAMEKQQGTVVKDVHHSLEKRGEPNAGRGEPRSHRVVKDVHTISPSNSPKNSPEGSFQKDGDKAGPYRIDHLLSDKARELARVNAPGWDLQRLMRLFDTSVLVGTMKAPKNPDLAFPAWCKSYTKGKRP